MGACCAKPKEKEKRPVSSGIILKEDAQSNDDLVYQQAMAIDKQPQQNQAPPPKAYNYTQPKPKEQAPAPSAVRNLDAQRCFQHYAGSSDVMEADALQKFYTDLDFSPDSVESFLVAYLFGVKDFMVMTHEEFDAAFTKMGVTTFNQLKAQLVNEVNQIRGEQKEMKAFYTFVFNVASKETGYRDMSTEIAVQLLTVLLGHRSIYEGNPFTKPFVSFVGLQKDGKTALQKDDFVMIPEFFMQYKTSFEDYDDSGSWPCLMDNFVEHFKESETAKNNQFQQKQMEQQISEKDLNQIVALLQKPFRSNDDVNRLQALLNQIHDYKVYTQDFHDVVKLKLCRLMQYAEFEEGHIVFLKGDTSTTFYFILSGELGLYKGSKISEQSLLKVMHQGESLGERGILMSESRSMSACALTKLRLIAVEANDFEDIMGLQVRQMMEQKIKFLQKNLPYGRQLTRTQLEKIAYCIKDEKVQIGVQVAKKGTILNDLCFIHTGECAIKASPAGNALIRLSSGSMFGEEGVLHDKPSPINIYVTSTVAELYRISRENVATHFTNEVKDQVSQNCLTRYKNRRRIEKNYMKHMRKSVEPGMMGEPYPLPHASPRALLSIRGSMKRRELSQRDAIHRTFDGRIEHPKKLIPLTRSITPSDIGAMPPIGQKLNTSTDTIGSRQSIHMFRRPLRNEYSLLRDSLEQNSFNTQRPGRLNALSSFRLGRKASHSKDNKI